MKNSSLIERSSKEAEEYGIDLSLIEINLQKTPAERILDMNNLLNDAMKFRDAINTDEHKFSKTTQATQEK